MILAADGSYPLLDVMWSMFLFFGLFLFFWVLMMVFGDLFRRHDIGGWAKTGWTVFVIFLPFLGAFTYLISQGHGMAERRTQDMRTQQQQMDEYIRTVASGNGATGATAATGATGVDDIARAKKLLDDGAISQSEFDALKRRALV